MTDEQKAERPAELLVGATHFESYLRKIGQFDDVSAPRTRETAQVVKPGYYCAEFDHSECIGYLTRENWVSYCSCKRHQEARPDDSLQPLRPFRLRRLPGDCHSRSNVLPCTCVHYRSIHGSVLYSAEHEEHFVIIRTSFVLRKISYSVVKTLFVSKMVRLNLLTFPNESGFEMDIAALVRSIDEEMERLEKAKSLLSEEISTKKSTPKGRNLSPEARERIAAAQRKRWAKIKRAKT